MKWITLYLTLLLAACSNPLETVTNANEEQEYTEEYQVRTGTKIKDGTYIKRHLNGDLLEESHYFDDKMEGEQKLYSRGKIYSISQFKEGKLEGLYQTFYPEGELNVEGEYVNNTMHGKWKRYYPSGDLMEVVNFENNEENGPFVEFYPNGNIKAEGAYLDGDNEHGELFLYDITGILFKKMLCEMGRCSTTWVKEGKEEWEGYRNN